MTPQAAVEVLVCARQSLSRTRKLGNVAATRGSPEGPDLPAADEAAVCYQVHCCWWLGQQHTVPQTWHVHATVPQTCQAVARLFS
jgi:hypothetical protein